MNGCTSPRFPLQFSEERVSNERTRFDQTNVGVNILCNLDRRKSIGSHNRKTQQANALSFGFASKRKSVRFYFFGVHTSLQACKNQGWPQPQILLVSPFL